MKKPSHKTVSLQNIWPLEATQFPAPLKTSTEVEAAPSMTCTDLGVPIQNFRSRQNGLFFSPDCACLFTWSFFTWSLMIFHQAYFSPCPPLRFLNFLDLSASPHLRLPGGFAYCSLPWREQPLESLDWVTAMLLFQGPPCSSKMSCSVQVLFISWWEKFTFTSGSRSTTNVSCGYLHMVMLKSSSPVLPRQLFWSQQN